MAKDRETVEVPAQVLADLKSQVEQLRAELRVAQAKEEGLHARQVYDAAWERRVAEAGKTPAQKTQDRSDRDYGTQSPRWRVRLEAVAEHGGNPPNVSEWPEVTISANSPEEAEARWMILCGVRFHRHRLRAAPATEAA